MITKHTPEPWHVVASPENPAEDSDFYAAAGPLEGFEPFTTCGCCGLMVCGETDEEMQANAELTVAAPKLFKIALLLDKIDRCTGYAIAKKDYPVFWEAQELARQILAEGSKVIDP